MSAQKRKIKSLQGVKGFVLGAKKRPRCSLTAVSLFSGAGLSDLGYREAGFNFVVQVEKNSKRASIGEANFPESTWIAGDVRTAAGRIDAAFSANCDRRLDLLVATPPCQGMSSSNPSRGKRTTVKARQNESRNSLLLSIVPVARRLRPRVIVAENVRQILTLDVESRGRSRSIIDLLTERLPNYHFWTSVVNVADYGVPQDRRRAVIVGVDQTESWIDELDFRGLAPWPAATHASEATEGMESTNSIGEWINDVGYERLDASTMKRSEGQDELHCVPVYDSERYRLVRDIPKNSGKSAYQNSKCPNCEYVGVAESRVKCPQCRKVMWNRPIVRNGRSVRLIAGFHSSYRRMRSDRPARTITTNSSHIGSDFKIHPFEHRVMSPRECADLQTVPRWYDWTPAMDSPRGYLVRSVVGEAFPPYFTFLHGRVLRNLLERAETRWKELAISECFDPIEAAEA